MATNRRKYGKRRNMLAIQALQGYASTAGTKESPAEENVPDPRIAELETELRSRGEVILRQKADFDNFRKRTMKEKEQIRDLATEDLLSKLLPVVDNFDRAIASTHSDASPEAVREGVEMISAQLNRVLQSAGLERIEATGKPFDPMEHEALATEERTDIPDNSVCEEMLSGYRYKEKVVRPAMVKVARAPSAEPAGEAH